MFTLIIVACLIVAGCCLAVLVRGERRYIRYSLLPWRRSKEEGRAEVEQRLQNYEMARSLTDQPYLHQQGLTEQIRQLLPGSDGEGNGNNHYFYALLPNGLVGIEDQLDQQGPHFVGKAPRYPGQFREGDICGNHIVLLPQELSPLLIGTQTRGVYQQSYSTPSRLQSIAFATNFEEEVNGVLAVGEDGNLLVSDPSGKQFWPLKGAPTGPFTLVRCWRGLILALTAEGRYWVGLFSPTDRKSCLNLGNSFREKNPHLAGLSLAGAGRIRIKGQWYGWVGTIGGTLWLAAEGAIFQPVHQVTSGDPVGGARRGLTDAVGHHDHVIVRHSGVLQHFREGSLT